MECPGCGAEMDAGYTKANGYCASCWVQRYGCEEEIEQEQEEEEEEEQEQEQEQEKTIPADEMTGILLLEQ